MIDPFILLAPLALVPIVLLFVFVGCPFLTQGTNTTKPLAVVPFKYHPDALCEKNIATLYISSTISSEDGSYEDTAVLNLSILESDSDSSKMTKNLEFKKEWPNFPYGLACTIYPVTQDDDILVTVTGSEVSGLSPWNYDAYIELLPTKAHVSDDLTLKFATPTQPGEPY